jgi:hypothetical protein
MDMRFGTWNIRSLYRSDSIKRILGKSGLGMWIGFVWIRIETGGGLL